MCKFCKEKTWSGKKPVRKSNESSLMMCSDCYKKNKTHYCSRRCQKKHWNSLSGSHKIHCTCAGSQRSPEKKCEFCNKNILSGKKAARTNKKPTLMMCSGCYMKKKKKTYYCSRRCQKKHWNSVSGSHKIHCACAGGNGSDNDVVDDRVTSFGKDEEEEKTDIPTTDVLAEPRSVLKESVQTKNADKAYSVFNWASQYLYKFDDTSEHVFTRSEARALMVEAIQATVKLWTSALEKADAFVVEAKSWEFNCPMMMKEAQEFLRTLKGILTSATSMKSETEKVRKGLDEKTVAPKMESVLKDFPKTLRMSIRELTSLISGNEQITHPDLKFNRPPISQNDPPKEINLRNLLRKRIVEKQNLRSPKTKRQKRNEKKRKKLMQFSDSQRSNVKLVIDHLENGNRQMNKIQECIDTIKPLNIPDFQEYVDESQIPEFVDPEQKLKAKKSEKLDNEENDNDKLLKASMYYIADIGGRFH
eukprot:747103_1